MRVLLTILLLGFAACGGSRDEPLDLGRVMDQSELVVLGEIRGEAGHERLFAKEVIKGTLGSDVRFRLGEEISPVDGPLPHRWGAGGGGAVVLFYAQAMGTLSLRMMFYGLGEHSYRVDGRELDAAAGVAALRKRANQMLEPTSGSVTPRADARVAPPPPVAHR